VFCNRSSLRGGAASRVRTLVQEATALHASLNLRGAAGGPSSVSLDATDGSIAEMVAIACRLTGRAGGRCGADVEVHEERLLLPAARVEDYEDERTRMTVAGLCALAIRLSDEGLASVVLHGSLATRDYCNYSDVDALVIVRSQAAGEPRRLQRLRALLLRSEALLLRHDVLQHHGFTVIPEALFAFYCQSVLPLETLRHAVSMSPEPCVLEIGAFESPSGALASLRRAARDVTSRVTGGVWRGTLHDCKLTMSLFMLLPSLYLQARGAYVYKRESFALAAADFEPEDWSVMQLISNVRLDWVQPVRLPAWVRPLSSLDPWIAQSVARRVAPESRMIPASLREPDTASSMVRLARKMVARAEESL
jgi:predicted nucleotidyltransferase